MKNERERANLGLWIISALFVILSSNISHYSVHLTYWNIPPRLNVCKQVKLWYACPKECEIHKRVLSFLAFQEVHGLCKRQSFLTFTVTQNIWNGQKDTSVIVLRGSNCWTCVFWVFPLSLPLVVCCSLKQKLCICLFI